MKTLALNCLSFLIATVVLGGCAAPPKTTGELGPNQVRIVSILPEREPNGRDVYIAVKVAYRLDAAAATSVSLGISTDGPRGVINRVATMPVPMGRGEVELTARVAYTKGASSGVALVTLDMPPQGNSLLSYHNARQAFEF